MLLLMPTAFQHILDAIFSSSSTSEVTVQLAKLKSSSTEEGGGSMPGGEQSRDERKVQNQTGFLLYVTYPSYGSVGESNQGGAGKGGKIGTGSEQGWAEDKDINFTAVSGV